MDQVTGEYGIQVLIPPDSSKREGERPGWTGGRYSWMRRVLGTELGDELYRKRKQTNRARVRAHQAQPQVRPVPPPRPAAVRTEWRLMMVTHNLTKLHSHQIATVGA